VKRKICFVINSRANYARIKSVIVEALKIENIEVQIVVGASAVLYNYGKVSSFIETDGITIDTELFNAVEGNQPISMAKTTGLATIDLAQEFHKTKPDLVVTVADRFETIATAIAASYMNIAVAHTQGGEITGSIDENVRHAITKLSHFHFPATVNAERVLKQLGEEPFRIHRIGCPSLDIAKSHVDKEVEKVLQNYHGVGHALDPLMPYILVSQHPDTLEFLNSRSQISQTLQAVTELDLQAIWLWPNIDAGSDSISKLLREYRDQNNNSKIHFYRNFTANDYISILKNSLCIIGNSSSGIREASFLGVPSVNIGDRQQGRERTANVIDVGYDKNEIKKAIILQIQNGAFEKDYTYGDGESGKRMARIIANLDLSRLSKKFCSI
jgi:UDP-hydrolysing UDP-N-acetyl-D-glucosamine 2-epimerase